MKKYCLVAGCLFILSYSFSQFKNIKISDQDNKYSPTEPSIAINKKNPKQIVVSTSPDLMITSNDGGLTWKTEELSSPFGNYGGASVISNSKGHLFYFHEVDPGGKGKSEAAWLDQIVCHTWNDEKSKWDDATSIGNNPPAKQMKAWPTFYPKKNGVYVTWTQFDKYESAESGCQSNILFSKSLNGNRFSKPVQINQNPGDCSNDDNSAMGAMPTVGMDGKIYIAWANQGSIYIDRSYDDGSTWLGNDLLITKQEAGWSMTIPGIEKSNGLPVLTVDNTESRFQGTMYLLYADQKNADDTDILLMRTRNRGDMWSKPERINKSEPGSHQFMPWITIDQTNSHVYIVYYDRRNYDDNRTDVYLSYSFDGGNNFSEIKISESPFVPDSSKKFGGHISIDAHAGVVIPVWTRMDDGNTSIWAAVIKDSDLSKPAPPTKK